MKCKECKKLLREEKENDEIIKNYGLQISNPEEIIKFLEYTYETGLTIKELIETMKRAVK